MGLSFFSENETSIERPTEISKPRNALWGHFEALGPTKKQTERATAKVLKKLPIFQDLSRWELGAVMRILYERNYQAEELIFHQDDPGLGMYIIIEGKVEIVREPTKHSLAELHEGDFFGELALLDELPRSASAIARTPVRLLGFFQPELLGLIERRPRLGIKIVMRLARIIGQRLRVTDDRAHAAEVRARQ